LQSIPLGISHSSGNLSSMNSDVVTETHNFNYNMHTVDYDKKGQPLSQSQSQHQQPSEVKVSASYDDVADRLKRAKENQV
jgi:hypothetical protein